MNRSTRVVFLLLLIASGITALVLEGAEYFVVFILGVLLWTGKYIVFWKGSGEKTSFGSYFFGDTPRPPTPWRRTDDDAGHQPTQTSIFLLFLRFRRRKFK